MYHPHFDQFHDSAQKTFYRQVFFVFLYIMPLHILEFIMISDDLCLRKPTGFSGYPPFKSPVSLYYIYKHMVALGVQFLRKMEWLWTANVMGALLWEPLESIKTGTAIEIGKEDSFQYFGMNPTKLLDWHKAPVLALHGKSGTQGMFLKMGEYFEKNKIGPLFTVNLSEGELNEKDREIIDQKILEIQSLYGYPIQIDILGYSRGAEMALYSSLPKKSYKINEGYCYQAQRWKNWRSEVKRIIRIGSMTTEEEWRRLTPEMGDKVIEIRGFDDIHMPQPSFSMNRIEIDGVGHVGLISSLAVFGHLKTILVEN